MSLADRIESRIVPPSHACPVAEILATLDDRDRAALERILKPKVMDSRDIARMLEAEGFEVKEEPVRRHKRIVGGRRLCGCP